MKIALALIAIILVAGCIEQLKIWPEYGEYEANYSSSHTYANVSSEMLFPNLRWRLPIKYYLNLSEAGIFDEENFLETINLWENWTDGTIKFERVYDPAEAGLYVHWKRTTDISNESKKINLGIAGPDKVVDTGLYNYSMHADLLLAPNYLSTCPRYMVIAHELGHVLGLGHSTDKDSLMYDTLYCWQKLTDADKQKLKEIYSLEALPDLYFKNVSIAMSERGMEIEFEIHNRGIMDSPQTEVVLLYGSKVIWQSQIGIIDPVHYGKWKIVYSERVRPENLVLKIDPQNTFRELDKDNNILVFTAKSGD